MATISHKDLTGSQIHEPKGVDSADFGSVYVADGEGSGSWDFIGFTTGDIKPTIKSTADSGWVMLDDGTIGSASSGATTRANSDTEALYTLFWTNITDTYAPVTGGRGVSAAADFAANKSIKLLKTLGRLLGGAGSGAGLSTRSLGQTVDGLETVTLTKANLPNYNLTVTDPGHTHTYTSPASSTLRGGGDLGTPFSSATLNTSSTTTGITVNTGGSGEAYSNYPPTTFINWMIKL